LVLYPNPTEGELNLKFNLSAAQWTKVQITDVSGKLIETHRINGQEGDNLVVMNTSHLASGSYLISMDTPKGPKTLPFIVK
jgi:methionine-rich copper-binding protein CopC